MPAQPRFSKLCAFSKAAAPEWLHILQLYSQLMSLSLFDWYLSRPHNKNIKDAFDGTTRPLRLRGNVEGTNHAETGQLHRRHRAQQPAFLGHDCLTGETAFRQATDGRVIPRPFVCRGYFTNTPPFITWLTSSSTRTSANGSPFTATRSAKRRGAMLPSSCSLPRSSAARMVALWIACIGVMP